MSDFIADTRHHLTALLSGSSHLLATLGFSSTLFMIISGFIPSMVKGALNKVILHARLNALFHDRRRDTKSRTLAKVFSYRHFHQEPDHIRSPSRAARTSLPNTFLSSASKELALKLKSHSNKEIRGKISSITHTLNLSKYGHVISIPMERALTSPLLFGKPLPRKVVRIKHHLPVKEISEWMRALESTLNGIKGVRAHLVTLYEVEFQFDSEEVPLDAARLIGRFIKLPHQTYYAKRCDGDKLH